MSLEIKDLLDLGQTSHSKLFQNHQYPWEVLSEIGKYLKEVVKPQILGSVSPQAVIEGDVFIDKGTIVEPFAYIKGPAWIGKNCQIRKGAYIRGNVISGDDCVLGNSCEFKNCVIFNNVQVPHFSYVGDSILGYKSHLASGVTLSNLKVTSGNIQLVLATQKIDTGLRKFGAIIGDFAEVGCHCVLNPGSIIGRHCILYPGVTWRGICPEETMVKLRQEHELTIRRK
jgi:NDP-sugar pyrophosphorylase family protein